MKASGKYERFRSSTRRLPIVLGVAALLLSMSAAASQDVNVSQTGIKQEIMAKLVDKARGTGRKVLVGVGLDTGSASPGETYAGRAKRYEKAQNEVLAALPPTTYQAKRRFRSIPFMSLWVDEHALRALVAHRKVRTLEEIGVLEPSLDTSTSIVGATDAWASGATGSGQAIAVLDTGVQRDHPFFSGKLAAEACFSTAFPTDNGEYQTTCPDGTTTQIGPGAGAHPASNVAAFYHGTHVAGIALGGTGAGTSGVAPGANLISIQVMTISTDPDICRDTPTPCMRAFWDDVAAGLEHVGELSSQLNIASANISLHTEDTMNDCNFKDTLQYAIESLRTQGIPTVVASGNSGVASGISYPACIVAAVSAGATTDSDTVAAFSNSSELLDLLAPGDNIFSSYPGSSYAVLSGTSMAAPHVSGAFAVLKAAFPEMSLDALEGALNYNGRAVTDPRNGVTKTRIDVNAALNALRNLSVIPQLMQLERWATGQGGFWTTQQWFTGDFNGDGYVDVGKAFADGDEASIDVHLSNGSGAFTIERWATKQGGFWTTQQWFTGDFNGDGKDDVAKVFYDNGLASIDVHVSDGAGFTIQRWATQQGGFWETQQWFTGDFNGDGQDDVAKAFDDWGLASIDVHLSNGTSFSGQRWTTQVGGFSNGQQWFAGDFNGDGKDDAAKAFDDYGLASIDVHLSDGTRFNAQRWTTREGGFSDEQQWFAADFNGDGKDDAAKAFNDWGLASIDVHGSNGSSFSAQRWATHQGWFWNEQQWFAGDFNGDGKADAGKAFSDGKQANIDVHLSL